MSISLPALAQTQLAKMLPVFLFPFYPRETDARGSEPLTPHYPARPKNKIHYQVCISLVFFWFVPRCLTCLSSSPKNKTQKRFDNRWARWGARWRRATALRRSTTACSRCTSKHERSSTVDDHRFADRRLPNTSKLCEREETKVKDYSPVS